MGVIGRLRSAASVVLHGDRRFEVKSSINVCRPTDAFKGRCVVVTGGYGSIGAAVCRRFAAAGADVLAAGRSGDSFGAELGNEDGIGFLRLDVSDVASVERAFSSIEDRLDVLVNCAGGSARQRSSALMEQDPDVIEEMLSVNLRGSLLCSRAACGIMARRGGGCIVNVSSVIGLRGKANFTEYAAAKAGISGYTRSLALEMGPYGVRVNCVSPGFIQRGRFGESQLAYNLRSNCLGAVGSVEDVAGAVVFLASDEARFITGQDLCVDGGRSLGLMGDSVW